MSRMNKKQFLDQGKHIKFAYGKTLYKAQHIGGSVYAIREANSLDKTCTIILEDTGFKFHTFYGDIHLSSEFIAFEDIILVNQ